MKVMGKSLGDTVKFSSESGRILTGNIVGFEYFGDTQKWQAVVRTPSGTEEVAVYSLKDA